MTRILPSSDLLRTVSSTQERACFAARTEMDCGNCYCSYEGGKVTCSQQKQKRNFRSRRNSVIAAPPVQTISGDNGASDLRNDLRIANDQIASAADCTDASGVRLLAASAVLEYRLKNL